MANYFLYYTIENIFKSVDKPKFKAWEVFPNHLIN